jgi:hypothetical protein
MIDAEFQLAAQLNVATLRIEFDWPLIENAPGVFDWSRADYIVRAAASRGIQLQVALVYTPMWASSQPASNMWYGVAAGSTADWTDFVTQVVTRYKGSVHFWEIWNEPDGGTYWYSSQSSGVQDWVSHLLIPGYTAIKAVDASAQVIIGPDHADTAWYDLVVSSGGGSFFDVLAFHSYTNATMSEVQTMQGWLNANGMASKPIWIGEYGIAEATNTTQDQLHQSLLNQVLTGTGYQQAQWYTLRDELPRSCCPISGSEARYFGIVQHDDATLKAGFATFVGLNP